ncbi:MAG: D-aminoacyl-tRNA deacylase [Victivallaceae bacterium]|nr:D-aminoacyl-tRNA deacylase [Victivallaceae bacterium]
MKALLQRVSRASVDISGETVGKIGPGLLILLGVAPDDTQELADAMAAKCRELRIFEDDAGKMNLSLADVGGSALVVSQFTLFGDISGGGRRPYFGGAARPEIAIPLYERFVSTLRSLGVEVATGRFGADMQVSLVNDGPVTLMLELPLKKD